MKLRWFGYIEKVVCDRDDLIFNPLFDFKGSSYCGCGSKIGIVSDAAKITNMVVTGAGEG